MSKVILYIAVSLDGFIADENGGISWLESFNADGDDFGYEVFISKIGTVIMGSATYEQVLTFGIDYPYAAVDSYIFTRRALPKPHTPANITFYDGDPAALVRDVKARTNKDIFLVGGGKLNATFFNHGLIDELRLFIMPIALGQGLTLFPGLAQPTSLKLAASHIYESGAVSLTYLPNAK